MISTADQHSSNRKVALVTGASQGIGWSIAERLARDGMIVIVNGQRPDAAAKAAETLVAKGAQAIALPADISDEQAVSRLFQEISARYGRLDVLINNAGISPRIDGRKATVENTPTEIWERTLSINLTGAFLTSRAAIPLMKQNNWGRIINMASQAGRMDTGFPGAYYAASKAGLIGFSRVMAGEVGPFGITVNCVSPGRIKTAMATTLANNEAVMQQYIDRTPLRRLGVPEDVAGAVSFLTSDESAFITGAVIDITGGFFMP
ncbi:MAG: SDR family NAD(P)-dependent oxidoreductase [Burkholderiales bacterium]|nr:SDR family NAD(P)-dependent oxidoreductase [Burkholderiales bacterium]